MSQVFILLSSFSEPKTGGHFRFDRLAASLIQGGSQVYWISPPREFPLVADNLHWLTDRLSMRRPVSFWQAAAVLKLLPQMYRLRSRGAVIVTFGESTLIPAFIASIFSRARLSLGIRSNVKQCFKITGGHRSRWSTQSILKALALTAWGWVYRRAEQVTVQTSAARDQAVRDFGICPSRVEIIENDIPVAGVGSYRCDSRVITPSRIIFVGDNSAVKGLDVLLGAIEKESFPTTVAHVDLVGVSALPKIVVGTGQKDTAAVTACGWVADPMVLMSSSHLLIVPSREDQFPNVVLEAMALGLPVIGSNTGGIAHMLADPFLLFTAGSSDSLVEAMRRVSTPVGYALARDIIAQRAAHFSFDWERRYQDILGQLRASTPGQEVTLEGNRDEARRVGSATTKQILYVTNRIHGSGIGGREQLSRLHGQILNEYFGDGFERIELGGTVGIGKLFGYLDGVSRTSIDLVCSRVMASGAKQVFLDGSNLGKLAEGIKKSIPGVEVVTFFHNCEARFFLGALRRSKSVKALAVLISNYLAERSAVRFSDKRVCLGERDSALLRRVYGRSATHISPMAMQDKFPAERGHSSGPSVEKYALFVGGAFYANQAGIAWFCEHVAPRVPLKTCVVGKGMELIKDDLERFGNVTVIGEVEDLAPWYLNAQVVVAPIFDGSGMKTKVAEALMFGKRVLGTPEAFCGYDDIAYDVGVICTDADDFVKAIGLEITRDYVASDAGLRSIYERLYSLPSARTRFANILSSFQ